MTTISAKIILDSIGVDAPRLTTVHCTYPLNIHGEVLTHKVFSRNSRSNRAVPIATMIDEAENNYAMPLHWGKAQLGMQAYEELTGERLAEAKQSWHRARRAAILEATTQMNLGLAKQNVNRILSPYIHIHTLITATEWSNFFALRDHHAAEPHIQILARAIKDAFAGSTPQLLEENAWHLPYVTDEEHDSEDSETLRMLSAARCARISYKPFSGESGDIMHELSRAMVLARQGHWTPFEHQARPDILSKEYGDWEEPGLHANFKGWVMNRKLFPNEHDFSLMKDAA